MSVRNLDSVDESVLLDLKQLLREAKQKVPPFLEQLESEVEQYQVIGGIRGCAYCGGLGHRITDVCRASFRPRACLRAEWRNSETAYCRDTCLVPCPLVPACGVWSPENAKRPRCLPRLLSCVA